VFYKLKAISELGIQIILHTFEYGRDRAELLEKYCITVHYYPRNNTLLSLLSRKPFIVKSRYNKSLLQNLKKDSYPILFEGLHTTYPLLKTDFTERIVLVRMHNIEQDYYKGLAESETNLLKKIFFINEAKSLDKYEAILHKANYILAISPYETNILKKIYKNKVVFIPPFHQHKEVATLTQNGKFALYHGDTRLSDNLRAIDFLIDVFSELSYPLVVAGEFLNKNIEKRIASYKHIEFVNITNKEKLEFLLKQAHIHVLPTFQKTGIKLKLINALYAGRFVIGNHEMLSDTGLEELCYSADTVNEMRTVVMKLSKKTYSDKYKERKSRILKNFDPTISAKKIIDLL